MRASDVAPARARLPSRRAHELIDCRMTTTRERLQALADGPMLNPLGRKSKGTKAASYSMSPGTGPAGETCKTCKHICRINIRSGRTFRKCGLAKHHWTHGPGSDIKASSPACRSWEKAE